MSTELMQYNSPSEALAIGRPPEQVLSEAKQAADALTKVIAGKKDPVKFNNQIYLEFEDWQTVAKFYGVTAKIEKTDYVQFGQVQGFEASAVALDRNGQEISRAESMCLNDEDKWGMRPKYKWVNNQRQRDGEVPTPLFQLRSMAQTRACAKVLRQVFAWVVVLAGYKPTVAEEMTGDEGGPEPQRKQPEVQRKSEKKAPFPPKKEDTICAECRMKNGHEATCSQHPDKKNAVPENAGDAYEGPDSGQTPAENKTLSREEQWNQYPGHEEETHISFKQGGLLFKVTSQYNDDDIKDYLKKNIGVEHRPLIPKDKFNALLDAFDPEFKFHEKK